MATRRALARLLAACLVASGAVACSSETSPALVDGGLPPTPGFGDGPVADRVVMSLVDSIERCDIDHRGDVVDLGGPMVEGRVVGAAKERLGQVEHDGATWSIVEAATLETTFVTTERTRLFAGARIASVSAKQVSLFIDDVPLGTHKLKPSEITLIETAPSELPFDPGEHTLKLRFAPARSSEVRAHVDWVRAGVPDELKATYGAPVLSDVLQPDAALAKVPHRALRLRTPSTVRCTLRVPPGARLRTAIGLLGSGEAEAEIVARVEGKAPVSLLRRAVKGGDAAAWEDVDATLDAFAGQLLHLELRASGLAPGRLLFGDPEIVVPTVPPEDVRRARLVLLVVLSGVEREELPGYSENAAPGLSRLAQLSAEATTFTRHRASSTLALTNLATMLTGLSPHVHTLTDLGAMLPATVPTLAQHARDAAVQTALFTGVPHTFQPFGLQRGLSHVVQISPAEGEGRDPLTEAAAWLETALAGTPNGSFFVVVHARGGHPPWVVPPKLADALPPENYTGEIQPRRAAEQLAAFRNRRSKVALPEPDRVRVAALHQVALAEQDRALGKLLDVVDTANLEKNTLLIVTTDATSGLTTLFADQPPLEERSLDHALYVSFPEGVAAGRKVDAASGVEDLTVTIARSLGLTPAKTWKGRDLSHVASHTAAATDDMRFALLGEMYAVRSGDLVLRERANGRAVLCDLALDPTCAFDRRAAYPLATGAMLRALARHQASQVTPHTAATLALDDGTLASLKVWGSMR